MSVDLGGEMAYGSGAIIQSPVKNAWVLTNWHVVRGRRGRITIHTSDGRKHYANILETDRTWDLAVLEIVEQPGITGLLISESAPTLGSTATIHGYGTGTYRAATGRVTQYVSPGSGTAEDMIVVSVQARPGDSGGPILAGSRKLVGILFGAGQGITTGSHCGPIRRLLDRCHRPRQLVPVQPQPQPQAIAQRGQQGKQGPAGARGQQGKQGPAGAPGPVSDLAELNDKMNKLIADTESLCDVVLAQGQAIKDFQSVQPGVLPDNDKPVDVVAGKTRQSPIVRSYDIQRHN